MMLADYPGQIVADLFGEEGYFAETELFWQKQNEAIAAKRDALMATGWSEERDTVTIANGDDYTATALLLRLLSLSDDNVLRVLAVVMGETLAAGSALVEAVGVYLKIDMTTLWQSDDAFFDLLRDKAVLNAMLAEVAGKSIADANIAEKTKTQKQIIRDCLGGTNGRVRVEN